VYRINKLVSKKVTHTQILIHITSTCILLPCCFYTVRTWILHETINLLPPRRLPTKKNNLLFLFKLLSLPAIRKHIFHRGTFFVTNWTSLSSLSFPPPLSDLTPTRFLQFMKFFSVFFFLVEQNKFLWTIQPRKVPQMTYLDGFHYFGWNI